VTLVHTFAPNLEYLPRTPQTNKQTDRQTDMSNPQNLYGAPRPKNKPIPLSSSSIHVLSTELSAARSALSRTEKSTPARARTKQRTTPKTAALFSGGHNKGVSERAKRDASGDGGGAGHEVEVVRGGTQLSERDLQRSRKSLLAKSKRYRQLQRGGAEAADALVDFDRKWGEEGSASSSDAEDDNGDDGDGDGEMVEYEDEFGRTRRGTKGEAERELRKREMASAATAAVSEGVRPPPPEDVICGNIIQTNAFRTPLFGTVPTSEELFAARAEREEADALETHYDASKEVRTKGVGFHHFSTGAEARKAEMEGLANERRQTELGRKEWEGRRKRKREELEKRREEIKAKRRVKVGGSWLENQFGDMLGGGQGEGGDEGAAR